MDQILSSQPMARHRFRHSFHIRWYLINTSIRSLCDTQWHTHTHDPENGPYRPDLQFVLMIFCVKLRGAACGKYACIWCDFDVLGTRSSTQFHVENHQYKLQIWAMWFITEKWRCSGQRCTEKQTYPCTSSADLCRWGCSPDWCRDVSSTWVPRRFTITIKIFRSSGQLGFPWYEVNDI